MKLFLYSDAVPPLFTLPEEESRHAVRVLRLAEGDTLHVADTRGTLLECQIVTADARACVVRVVESFPDWERRPYRLTLALAPTKNSDRLEWFLEKATEIGVDRIVPIECANSERRVMFKPERALRVIESAAKQSLKASLPVLDEITAFKKLVEGSAGVVPSLSMSSPTGRPLVKLIAHCRPETPRVLIDEVLTPQKDTLILIGPEGDFTAQEVSLAEKSGFTSVSLGASRLRTETAALVAVTAVYLRNQK